MLINVTERKTFWEEKQVEVEFPFYTKEETAYYDIFYKIVNLHTVIHIRRYENYHYEVSMSECPLANGYCLSTYVYEHERIDGMQFETLMREIVTNIQIMANKS